MSKNERNRLLFDVFRAVFRFSSHRKQCKRKIQRVAKFLGDEIQNSVFAVCASCRRLRVCKISGRSVERTASEIFFSEVSHCSEWPQVKSVRTESLYIYSFGTESVIVCARVCVPQKFDLWNNVRSHLSNSGQVRWPARAGRTVRRPPTCYTACWPQYWPAYAWARKFD